MQTACIITLPSGEIQLLSVRNFNYVNLTLSLHKYHMADGGHQGMHTITYTCKNFMMLLNSIKLFLLVATVSSRTNADLYFVI